jgi:outer membrane lipoprotein-sorting protein
MKISLLALCVWTFATVLPAQSVDTVLARMDKDAPSFHAMSANVEMLTYNALLADKTVETGTLQMQRLKPGSVRAILAFTGGQGDARTIAFLGKNLRVYYPKLNMYQDFQVGKNSDVLNQYLLLGFGSSGKELAQSYTIKSAGIEKVAGQSTSKLQLDPKDENVKTRLQKILVWIPDDGANPVQQQFYEPSGNYRKLTYTGIVVNPPISGTLELKLPSTAKKQKE